MGIVLHSPVFPIGRETKRISIYVESVRLNHKKKHLLTTKQCVVTNSEAPIAPAPRGTEQHNQAFLDWRLQMECETVAL